MSGCNASNRARSTPAGAMISPSADWCSTRSIRLPSAPGCRRCMRPGRKNSAPGAGRCWRQRAASWADASSFRGASDTRPDLLIPLLQLAKPLPALAVEAHELHLVDRHMIGRAGVDLDPREQHRQFEILYGVGVLEDVVGREVVAASLQYRLECHRAVIGVDVIGVVLVRV